MAIVADLTNTNYNYIIIRGGEAGCVTASRLAEALPDCKIPMIGAGPSDLDNKSILDLRSMDNLMGGEFDYGFKSTEQPNVNSNIFHLRAKVLSGCSSHNDKIRATVMLIYDRHQKPIVYGFLYVNHEITSAMSISKSGVSLCSLTYDQDTGYRVNASVAYIYPILRGEEKRLNLTVLTNAWIYRIDVIDGFTTGVNVTLQFKELENLGIQVINDLLGVGENLQNHPEVIITWELHEPREDKTVLWADVALLACREPPNIQGGDGTAPDALMHIYTIPFDVHQAALGYASPKTVISLTPHSADPGEHPAINFRYFTDPDGYDEKTIHLLSKWIKRGVAPGSGCQTDQELSEYRRKTPIRLRIADASVFPLIPIINLILTVLAVGQRTSEIIIANANKNLTANL
ncbi:uncharacterized protein FOBCDRAFT_244683 [Fusarium oxysporum Fo47]|nr:uncharacterized protein FOBCDRAFT_244683 [Fusarium oxysporum Fo47]QKD61114.2 hypothetical protein FOBCDRAFT_244683 [Fusarium oxysporum Fo47]